MNLNSINTEVVKLDIGLKTNSETLGTKNDVLISKTSNEYDGVILSGLSEKKEDNFFGYTQNNKLINFTGKAKIGDIVNVEVLDAKTWSLDGKISE